MVVGGVMEAEQKEKTGGGWSSVGEGRRILSRSGPTSTRTNVSRSRGSVPPIVRLAASHPRTILLAALLFFWVTVVRANGPWLKHFQALSMQQRAASHGSDHLYSHFFSRPQKYFQGFFVTGRTERRFGCTAAAAAFGGISWPASPPSN